ncbi:MAG: hypothetical protein ACRCXH_14115, partial [Shewanella sp.]
NIEGELTELGNCKDVHMKLLLVLLVSLLPTMVWAHEGHGGVGFFHHLLELLPAIILVALIAVAGVWAKNRK